MAQRMVWPTMGVYNMCKSYPIKKTSAIKLALDVWTRWMDGLIGVEASIKWKLIKWIQLIEFQVMSMEIDE